MSAPLLSSYFPKYLLRQILHQNTMTAKTEYFVETFSFKQPFQKHQWTKSKSRYAEVVVYDMLHVTMQV